MIEICSQYSNKKQIEFINKAIAERNFESTTNELGISQEVNNFIKIFCTELMVAMGKQMVIILDNENIKKTGNLSAEE